jgi:hypothetical protein
MAAIAFTILLNALAIMKGIPLMGRVLIGPEWKVFAKIASLGVVVAILSVVTGLWNIPVQYSTGFTQNVGYLFRNNWTWPYIIVWPVTLILFRRLSDSLRSSVVDLETMKILVQTKKSKQSFTEILEAKLAKTGATLFYSVVIGTSLFVVLDTLEITQGYYFYYRDGIDLCTYSFTEEDWSVFFAEGCWQRTNLMKPLETPSLWLNGAFNIAAYSMQTVMVITFTVLVLRLAQFFIALADALQGSNFTLDPWLDDPDQRLGLGRLGRAYNLFLTLIIIFETYVAGHRLQQIALREGISVLDYLRQLLALSSQPADWFDPELHMFGTADVGTISLIIVVVVPLTLICWFPLLKMRSYITTRKAELTKEWAMKRHQAELKGDSETAKRFERQTKQLDKANVWPNGDATAQRFILAMGLLWVGSIFPVLFVSAALGAFGLLEVIRFGAWVWDRYHKAEPA